MTILHSTLRFLLGSILLIFGLNGLLQLFPLPETTIQAKAFLDSLWSTGYLMQVVKTTEIVCGLALLFNRGLPLALLVLAPITLNILLVDVFLQPQYAMIGYIVFTINWILIYLHRASYFFLLINHRESKPVVKISMPDNDPPRK